MGEITMTQEWFDKFVAGLCGDQKDPGRGDCCVKQNHVTCTCVDDGSFCNKQPDDKD